MLIDTDVLIWNMRGNERAAELLDGAVGFTLSAVTYMELVQAARDKAELRALRRALQFWQATLRPLDDEISNRAMYLIETYALSHGLQMADALIAATAISLGDILVTGNDKHYRMIDGLEIEVFRP
jgi:predicted nucleic acid-binding protein